MAGRGRPSRSAVSARLDTEVAELWDRLGGLPRPEEAADVWRGIWFEEAHHSTAIEGNTLVLKQVEALLEQGRAVGNKELSEYMEVKGYADAAEWVYRQAIEPFGQGDRELVTLTETRNVHHTAMTPVWDIAPHPDAAPAESPGNFRRHDIRPFPDGMTPPSWSLVPAETEGWIRQANSLQPRTPQFPEDLAGLHCRFEQIHPFLDGNGRTGRLLINLILVRLGYPPVIIHKRQRSKYLKALRQADAGSPGPLGELLARAIIDNLHRFVIPAVAGPNRLVPIAALARKEISAAALRTAATRGALQADQSPDGRWTSTSKWVDDYLRNRYKRT
ncbi:MAG: Fic family protein [Candidatus Nanopelagicales bacterium]|nr:Fic family protein [Candidatus Nanopelagicales bacterium]MDZ4250667.1 Fic family protein [Candidatus Nanopelagicales bacterium]MDZ7578197.1 Fic family protein [Candidatus Nanopelagicales bacterium]